MQETIRETNFRWIGYAYFAVGIFAFVLLQDHPLPWLRFAFIALTVVAAWYFITVQKGQRLWVEDETLHWDSRSAGLPHRGACKVQDIRSFQLNRFSGRRRDDGEFTRVCIVRANGERIPLPTGLRLGEGRYAKLEDVVAVLRKTNPRLVVNVERTAPDFALWERAVEETRSNASSSSVLAMAPSNIRR